jgi:hypothetical protein
MMIRKCPLAAVALALAAALSVAADSAHATLKFYYDPLTGNVSMDTTETRSGGVYVYSLNLIQSVHFRPENHIRITSSTFYDADAGTIGEGSLSDPWFGLYTIGDVLPVGLSEQTWTSLFTFNPGATLLRSQYIYSDLVGGGAPPPATFIYGRPEGEFQNALDLVDPDALDWADQATLKYYPQSGKVVLDTTGAGGGYITGILLESNGAFRPGEFATTLKHSDFNVVSGDEIALFGDLVAPGEWALGDLLPADLSLSEVQSTLKTAEFFGRAGFGTRNLDVETAGSSFNIQVVPEPATAAILAAGLAIIPALRRRRN